jgi:phenylalanyl-tRNA synthetase beta subunit
VFPIYDNNAPAPFFPPVINSAKIGAVKVGDSALFVEMSDRNWSRCSVAAFLLQKCRHGLDDQTGEVPFPRSDARTARKSPCRTPSSNGLLQVSCAEDVGTSYRRACVWKR